MSPTPWGEHGLDQRHCPLKGDLSHSAALTSSSFPGGRSTTPGDPLSQPGTGLSPSPLPEAAPGGLSRQESPAALRLQGPSPQDPTVTLGIARPQTRKHLFANLIDLFSKRLQTDETLALQLVGAGVGPSPGGRERGCTGRTRSTHVKRSHKKVSAKKYKLVYATKIPFFVSVFL